MIASRLLLRSALCVVLLFSSAFAAQAATLLKYNFESGNTWTAMAGYGSATGGSVTSTPTVAAVGTVDTYGTATASSGVQLLVNSSSATGTWTAGVDSGVLSLLASTA